MKKPLNIGVVGSGAIGIRCMLMHLTQPDVAASVRITAICDAFPGRADAAARKFSIPASYMSIEELLADPQVDAVTLCTPIGLHYQQAIQAIQAGKHVHFNKTMTTTVDEADHLMALAKEKGVCMVASPGMMLHPHNRLVRRLVLEGALGRLVWTVAGVADISRYHLNEEFRNGQDVLSNVDPTWYFQKPGGGPQYDVTVYCLHNLTGILGPAQRVTALSGVVVPQLSYQGRPIEVTADDNTILLLDFGNTFFGVVYATVAGSMNQGFQPNIYGTAGAVIGTRFAGQELTQEGSHQPHVNGVHAKMAESHVFEDVMQLVDWVRDGTPSIANAEHARHVIDIIESGYRASQTGETQTLRTTFTPLPLNLL